MCLWGAAAAEWRLAKALKGHAGAVHALCAHPAGAAALSVARDRQMRLWDLAVGRCAYQAPLGGEGLAVEFLEGGSRYAVAVGAAVTLHSTQVCTYWTSVLFACVAAAPGSALANARSAMNVLASVPLAHPYLLRHVERQSAASGICTCAQLHAGCMQVFSLIARTQSMCCVTCSQKLRVRFHWRLRPFRFHT